MVPSILTNENERIKFNLLQDFQLQTPPDIQEKFLLLLDGPMCRKLYGKKIKSYSVGCDFAEPGAEKTVDLTPPKDIVKPGDE